MMMGSVAHVASADFDSFKKMLEILSDQNVKSNLDQMTKLRDEILKNHHEASTKLADIAKRESAVKAREDKVEAAEKKMASDRAELNRRLGILKQAMD